MKAARVQVKNARRRRQRVVRKLKYLDTDAVMAVLMERGVAARGDERAASSSDAPAMAAVVAPPSSAAATMAAAAGEPTGAAAAIQAVGDAIERPADEASDGEDGLTLGRPSPAGSPNDDTAEADDPALAPCAGAEQPSE